MRGKAGSTYNMDNGVTKSIEYIRYASIFYSLKSLKLHLSWLNVDHKKKSPIGTRLDESFGEIGKDSEFQNFQASSFKGGVGVD